MHMIPVVSSNIKSIGYEDNTLYVCFNSGSTYKYLNVPKSVYDALMSASSHGGYLAAHIKGIPKNQLICNYQYCNRACFINCY